MGDFSLYPTKNCTDIHKIIVSFVLLVILMPQIAFASVITPQTIIDLTNSERLQNGQDILNTNSALIIAAQQKAKNMVTEGYFDHYGPNGETPWQYIVAADYKYQYAGENLAMNFSRTENVVKAWMKSAAHRDNILDPHYQEIGVAVADGVIDGEQTTLVVQMFGAKPESVIESISSKISVVDYVSDLLGISSVEK